MKCGITKKAWDSTMGIHPTIAEGVLNLKETKANNPNASKGSC